MRRLMLGIAVAVTTLLPSFGMANDQQIADFIKGRLQVEQQKGNLRGFNVDMRVDRGTVWFKGHVSNSNQEMMILRTAQQAGHLGVVQVVDDIEVQAQQSVMEQTGQTPEFRNAGYQQSQQGQDQYRQTSSQEYVQSMPSMGGAADGVISNGAPLAFANSATRGLATPAMKANGPMRAPMAPMGMQPGPPMGMQPGGPPMGPPMGGGYGGGAPMPSSYGSAGMPSEAPNLPGYAWPGYAAHPNYGAVSYPKQYSPSAWPYIGPFYPYPQVPLGWRKVSLEWDDGWWMLDFNDK